MPGASNIRHTLKKNLFTAPKPPIGSLVYERIRHHLFPEEELFVSFLEENNLQNQIEKAKQILIVLSFRTKFSPPTRLLLNILNLESSLSGKHQKGFVSRDHFVHLVNLYLLGIYTFLYHQPLHANLIQYFYKQRRKSRLKCDAYRLVLDFGYSWRTFVLFHDLAYPLEYWVGNEEDFGNNKTEIYDHLRPFQNLSSLLKNDISLKALVKFLWGYELVYKNQGETFGLQMLRESGEFDNLTQVFFDRWASYKHIEKVYTSDSLSSLTTICKDEIVGVLSRTDTDEVLAIVKRGKEELLSADEEALVAKDQIPYFNGKIGSLTESEGYICFTSRAAKNIKALQGGKKVIALYKRLGQVAPLKTEWKIYIDNPEVRFENFFDEVMKGTYFEDFATIANGLINRFQTDYTLVSDKFSTFQHQVELYNKLYANFFQDPNDIYANLTQGERFKNIRDPKMNSAKDNLGKTVAKILEKEVEEGIEAIKNEDLSDLKKSITLIIEKLGKNPAKIADKIISKISDDVKNDIDSTIKIHSLWTEFTNGIPLANISGISAFKRQLRTSNSLKLVDIEFNYEKVLGTELGKSVIEKLRHYKLENLLTSGWYTPGYLSERGKFCDHGIAAAICCIDTMNAYDSLVKYTDPNGGAAVNHANNLVDMAFGLHSAFEVEEEYHRRNQLLPEVIAAIALHNVYPSDLTVKYINSIDKAPFTFFSVLIDSLQPWDRKRNHNAAFKKSSYTSFGDKFDMKIVKDRFYIHEASPDLDIKEQYKVFKDYLDLYLKDASSIIKVSFAEYSSQK